MAGANNTISVSGTTGGNASFSSNLSFAASFAVPDHLGDNARRLRSHRLLDAGAQSQATSLAAAQFVSLAEVEALSRAAGDVFVSKSAWRGGGQGMGNLNCVCPSRSRSPEATVLNVRYRTV